MIGCGSIVISYSFFITYTFLVAMIFLQLFIAIILQGYEDTQTQESRLFNNDATQQFREAWADLDPSV